MEILWLILLVAFAIVEGVTVSLVSVWFIGGAAAALIAALCGAEVWLQVVLFFGVSIVLTILPSFHSTMAASFKRTSSP